jgi:tetratricopeptide (TPR) repeat protein
MATEPGPEPRWKKLAKAALLALRGGAERAVSSQIARAQDLIRKRRYADAIEVIDRAVKTNPSEAAFLLFLKAGCLSSLGNERGAEEMYEEVLRIDPSHPGAARMLRRSSAKGAMRNRECFVLNEAGEDADSASSARRLRMDDLIRKGKEAQAAGDRPQLLIYLDELIELGQPDAIDPTWRAQHAVSYAWRAAVHVELGNYKQAIEDSRTCRQLDPSYWKVTPILEAAEEGLNRQLAAERLDHLGTWDPGGPGPGGEESETWIRGDLGMGPPERHAGRVEVDQVRRGALRGGE